MESVVAEQVDETLMLADLTSQASLENPHWTAEHQKLAKFNENKEVRKQQELVDVVGLAILKQVVGLYGSFERPGASRKTRVNLQAHIDRVLTRKRPYVFDQRGGFASYRLRWCPYVLICTAASSHRDPPRAVYRQNIQVL